MKLKLYSDEWHQVLSIQEGDTDMGTTEVEVPDETAQRWKRILAEFDEMQEEMRKATENSK